MKLEDWAENSLHYVSGDTEEELMDYYRQPLEWSAAEYAYENILFYYSEIDKLLMEDKDE